MADFVAGIPEDDAASVLVRFVSLPLRKVPGTIAEPARVRCGVVRCVCVGGGGGKRAMDARKNQG